MKNKIRRWRFVGTIAIACSFVVSCDRFASPSVEGEAFLVMKSLDVKKLGDLKIYLLRDPSVAVADLKKTLANQYEQSPRNIARSNSAIQMVEQKIRDLKAELAKIDGDKQKALEGVETTIDEKLRQLREQILSREVSTKTVGKQINDLTEKTASAQTQLEGLKQPRKEMESGFAKRIEDARKDLVSAERDRTEYMDKALTGAAKMLNDQILSRNLKIDLVPKDGRFGRSEEFNLIEKFNHEIFESKEDSFPMRNALAIDLTPGRDYRKHYLVLQRFPRDITEPTVRQSFYSLYLQYSSRRATLDAAVDMAKKNLASLNEGVRLALQKYDFQFQEGSRLRSLEKQVLDAKEEIGELRKQIGALSGEISTKRDLMNKPRAEEIAAIRDQIEKSFFERRATIDRKIKGAENELAATERELLDRQWKILKDDADEKLASIISSTITASARTDADGRFKVLAPAGGDFVIYTQTTTPSDEKIFWFERVRVGGKTLVKLTNSNSQKASGLAELLLEISK